MSIAVTIAGNDLTDLVSVGSLRISDRINSRSRLSLSVVFDQALTSIIATEADEDIITEASDDLVLDQVYLTDVGSVVTINEDYILATEAGDDLLTEAGDELTTEDVAIFGGYVDAINETLVIDGNQSWLRRDLECVSYDSLADRRLVAASYTTAGQTLYDVVSSIVTTFLSGEGINTSNVAADQTIPPVKFNYQTISGVFDELASITGYAWWIDQNKNLYFKARSAIAAPFAIDADNARRVTITQAVDVYRNRQYVRAGVDLTASRTESFVGNGTQKAWVLAFPVGDPPDPAVDMAITVGGVAKTVGIRGKDTGKDWYYQVGDSTISQDDAAAAVAASVTIAATYRGQFPILVSAQDDAQIASQAALSGGSGVWETIEDRSNINDDETASTIAEGLLRRYGRIPRRISFETDRPGLRAGQILTATFTPHGVSGSWLIDSVSASDRNGRDIVWTVEALDGETIGGWETFFQALSPSGRVVEFRENEVLILIRAASETVTFTDSITTSSAAPVTTVGAAIVGYSEVGT